MHSISSVPVLNFYSSAGISVVKCCVAYLADSKVHGSNPHQGAEPNVSGRVSGVSAGASRVLEVLPTLCNLYKAWYSHSLVLYDQSYQLFNVLHVD